MTRLKISPGFEVKSQKETKETRNKRKKAYLESQLFSNSYEQVSYILSYA